MEKKTNLEIYHRVDNFKKDFKTDQKLQLKLAEASLLLESVKSQMESQNERIDDVKTNISLLADKKDLESLKLQHDDHIRKTERESKDMNKKMVEITEIISKLKEDTEEYVKMEVLEQYAQDVENTIQDFIVSSTPRNEPKVLESQNEAIDQLNQKVNVLYENTRLLRDELDETIRKVDELETRNEQKEPLKDCFKKRESVVDPIQTQKEQPKREIPNLKIKKSKF